MAVDTITTSQVETPPSDTVGVPAPTAWPITLAFGVTLIFAGLISNAAISALGAILVFSGCVGWFRDVLPHEKHESLIIADVKMPVVTSRTAVARVAWVTPELQRARLPLEIYPISAGVKGGLSGSVAMAVLAIAYGIFSGHGFWYPINLIASGFFPARETIAQVAQFHWGSLIIATAVHLFTSLVVGVLYGAMLPMFPRRPILLGGLIAPILWSGLIHGGIQMLNSPLLQRINWPWFVVSQIGFGVVAGIVVSKQERVRTWQHLPMQARAGVETPGAVTEKGGERAEEDRQ